MKQARGIVWGVLLFVLYTTVALAENRPVSTSESVKTAIGQETQTIELLGQFGGLVSAVAVQGQYAYVSAVYGHHVAGNEGSRLYVLAVSNPARLVMVGQSSLIKGTVSKIVIKGQMAYLIGGTGSAYVQLVNITDPANLEFLGEYHGPSSVQDLVVVGNLMYVADRDVGLRIVNVADPHQPVEVGFLYGLAHQVQVQGNYAFVGDGMDLRVIDISDPAHPFEAGQFFPKGNVNNVVVANGRLYLTDLYEEGCNPEFGCVIDEVYFRILDISNPTTPTQITTLTFQRPTVNGFSNLLVRGDYGYYIGADPLALLPLDPTANYQVTNQPLAATSLAIAGNYVYTVNWDSGVVVSSIIDPAHLDQVGTYPSPSFLNRVRIVDDYAYITGPYGGLEVIDVANSSAPDFQSINENISFENLVRRDGFAYLTDSPAGSVHVLDTTDLAHPDLVETYAPSAFFPVDASLSGNYAYVALRDSVAIIDVSDPAKLTESGLLELQAEVTRVEIANNYLYVGTAAGLVILDISNPTTPTQVGLLPLGGLFNQINAIAVQGNLVYLSDSQYTDTWHSYLQVIDISVIATPTVVKTMPLTTEIYHLKLAGNRLYFLDTSAHIFYIYDLSQPVSPALVGSYLIDIPLGTIASDVDVVGQYAYIIWDDGLRILNVADPANPTQVGFNEFYKTPVAIVVRNGLAYVLLTNVLDNESNWNWQLRILNVSNPTTPTLVNTYQQLGYGRALALNANIAYIAEGDSFRLIDISAPAAPGELGAYSHLNYPHDAALVDNYLLVTADEPALTVLDASIPTNLTPVTTFFLLDGLKAQKMVVDGDYAYLTTNRGLVALDIADPTNPTQVGFYQSARALTAIAQTGHYLYAAQPRFFINESNKILIIDIANPMTPTLAGEYSNVGDMVIHGGYAYLINLGIYILDITDPVNPAEVVHYAGPGADGIDIWYEPVSIDVANSLIYTTDEALGLAIFHYPSSSETITPAGGTLTYTNRRMTSFTLQAPADAVTSPTIFFWDEVGYLDWPIGLALVGPVLDLTITQAVGQRTNFTFAQPVSLSVVYSEADSRFINDETQLHLYRWQNGRWVAAGQGCSEPGEDQVDPQNNTVSGTICQTGRYALFGPTNNGFWPALRRS